MNTANSGHYTAKIDTPYGWVNMNDGACKFINKTELCTPLTCILFYKRIKEILNKEHPNQLRGGGQSVPVKVQIKKEQFQKIAKAGQIPLQDIIFRKQ